MAQDTRGSESKIMGRIVNYCVERLNRDAQHERRLTNIRLANIECLISKILDRQQILFERQEIIMAAIDNLAANVAKLQADVQALVAAHQAGPSEAQVQAQA